MLFLDVCYYGSRSNAPAPSLQAWAVFKGKFKEGEKAEPATWKTRLRCALNKSPDFEEVGDRSQLDISEPYKVYRIVPEEEQKSEFIFHYGDIRIMNIINTCIEWM